MDTEKTQTPNGTDTSPPEAKKPITDQLVDVVVDGAAALTKDAAKTGVEKAKKAVKKTKVGKAVVSVAKKAKKAMPKKPAKKAAKKAVKKSSKKSAKQSKSSAGRKAVGAKTVAKKKKAQR